MSESDNKQHLADLRHSAAHLLAAAVMEMKTPAETDNQLDEYYTTHYLSINATYDHYFVI